MSMIVNPYRFSDPAFVTTWQTTGASETITIPITGSGYSFTVDWGDGTIDTGLTSSPSHVYAAAGTKTIRITGTFPRIYFNNAGMRTKIRTVANWGNVGWTSMANAFYGCTGLTSVAAGVPNVTSCSGMFRSTTALSTVPAGLFLNCTSVTSFSNCFNNAGITAVSANMFAGCSGATDFDQCFYSCPLTVVNSGAFDGCSAVTAMTSVFWECTLLATIPAGLFDDCVSVTSFSECFRDCALTSIPTGLFDYNTVAIGFTHCFSENNFSTIPAGLFDNTAATSLSNCFYDCNSLTAIPANMFAGCTTVTTFADCFNHCGSLSTIGAGAFDNCAAVTTFSECFRDCNSLVTVPDGLFDDCTAVTSYSGTFRGCTSLTALDFGTWDWVGVTTASNFLLSVTINTTDYNASWIGLDAQSLNSTVAFHGGSSVATGTGLTARNNVITDHTWTVTDAS